jgi:hypothetical protein
MERSDVTAEIDVRATTAGLERRLHRTRLSLTGTRSRLDVARYLKGRLSASAFDWEQAIEDAAWLVLDDYRAGEPAILLREAVSPEGSPWLVPPLILAHQPTIWFGDGSSAKSLLALAAGLAIQAGSADLLGITPTARRNVLLLDYEWEAWEHLARMRKLVGEPMPDLVYRRCLAPLQDEVDVLLHLIAERDIGFVIIDSIGPACGGEPEVAAVALAFFAALRQLGVGALCLAHTIKNGSSEERPFGSTFWHNGA